MCRRIFPFMLHVMQSQILIFAPSYAKIVEYPAEDTLNIQFLVTLLKLIAQFFYLLWVIHVLRFKISSQFISITLCASEWKHYILQIPSFRFYSSGWRILTSRGRICCFYMVYVCMSICEPKFTSVQNGGKYKYSSLYYFSKIVSKSLE